MGTEKISVIETTKSKASCLLVKSFCTAHPAKFPWLHRHFAGCNRLHSYHEVTSKDKSHALTNQRPTFSATAH